MPRQCRMLPAAAEAATRAEAVGARFSVSAVTAIGVTLCPPVVEEGVTAVPAQALQIGAALQLVSMIMWAQMRGAAGAEVLLCHSREPAAALALPLAPDLAARAREERAAEVACLVVAAAAQGAWQEEEPRSLLDFSVRPAWPRSPGELLAPTPQDPLRQTCILSMTLSAQPAAAAAARLRVLISIVVAGLHVQLAVETGGC